MMPIEETLIVKLSIFYTKHLTTSTNTTINAQFTLYRSLLISNTHPRLQNGIYFFKSSSYIIHECLGMSSIARNNDYHSKPSR